MRLQEVAPSLVALPQYTSLCPSFLIHLNKTFILNEVEDGLMSIKKNISLNTVVCYCHSLSLFSFSLLAVGCSLACWSVDSCNTRVRISMNGEWKNLGVESGGREKLMRITGVDGTYASRSSRSQQRGEKRQGVNADDSQQCTGWRD